MASKWASFREPTTFTDIIPFIAAYFTQVFVHQLGTVDDIPCIWNLAIPEGIFKSSRSGKNHSQKNRFQPDERRLDMSMAAMRQSPVTYEIQCSLPLSPPHNNGYHRHDCCAYPSERLLPSNSHRPSIATNSTASSHSNSYHPYSQSRLSLPPSTITAQQSENPEKDPFNYPYGYTYQALQAAPMNSFMPHDSISYPLNLGYAPIAPPLTHLSLTPERLNNVQSLVSSLTMLNHLSYVRPALGPLHAIHEPAHHPLDEEDPTDDLSITIWDGWGQLHRCFWNSDSESGGISILSLPHCISVSYLSRSFGLQVSHAEMCPNLTPTLSVLISPWCDLNLSFPSVVQNTKSVSCFAHTLTTPSDDISKDVHASLRFRIKQHFLRIILLAFLKLRLSSEKDVSSHSATFNRHPQAQETKKRLS